MLTGVIDIGTSEIRLLVAAGQNHRTRVVMEQRQPVTRAGLDATALAGVSVALAAVATDAGAESLLVVGSHHYRGTHLERALDRRLRQSGLGGFRVLGPAEEVALNFIGASAVPAAEDADDPGRQVTAIRLGRSSVQVAVGEAAGRPGWWASRPLGIESLISKAGHNDPPTEAGLAMMIDTARREFANLHPPATARAVISGPGAFAATVCCNGEVSAPGLIEARRQAAFAHSEILAGQLDIEPAQARRVPATLALLQVLTELVGRPLEAVHAGKLEGLVLARSGGVDPGAALRWVQA